MQWDQAIQLALLHVIFFKQPYFISMYEHHSIALENTFFLNICLICNVLICHRTLVSAELLENHKCKQKTVKQKWLELLLNNDIDPENKNQKMPSWSAFNSVVSKETLSQKIVGFCQLFLVL